MRHAADLDHVARHESFQHMQCEVVRAKIEWNADAAICQLLWSVDRRIRPHRDRGIRHDSAAADLSAAHARVLDAAVVAPFAGVVHVGLALLQQPAMAVERVQVLRARDVYLRGAVDAGIDILPDDLKSFLGEQAFGVRHQFRQSLEWCRRFQMQCFHCANSPRVSP